MTTKKNPLKAPSMKRTAARDRIAIAAAENEKKALGFRKQGMSYARIAEELGFSGPGSAYKSVQRGISNIPREEAEEMRQIEAERLDRAWLAIEDKVRRGDLNAIDRMIRIQERRARMFGLDMPKKLEMSGPEGGPIQTEDYAENELLTRLARIAASLKEDGGDPPADEGAEE